MTYNIRIIKIEGKMFSVPSLATTAALTAVQDNTPRISKKNLVKKKEKQIMMRKYQTLKVNVVVRLIIINLRVICQMQKEKKRN